MNFRRKHTDKIRYTVANSTRIFGPDKTSKWSMSGIVKAASFGKTIKAKNKCLKHNIIN